MNENKAKVPSWAPRVTQREIRRLYECDATGIYDEFLINEVGYGLLARCEAFIDAMEAIRGKARCPCCSSIVVHDGRKEEVLHCACGWALTWGEYFRTIQHKQLSGAEPVLSQFRAFVKAFPAAANARERMLLIDRLIHGFHWYYQTGPTRPVAINLIEGRLGEVVAFLEELSYSAKSTPGLAKSYAEWDQSIEANCDWYPSRRGRMAEQSPAADATSRRR